MYATDFEYANERLSDYGMMICSFDGSNGFETVASGADVTFQQIKSPGSSRFNLYGSTYEAAYTATFQICKNPCLLNSQTEMPLSVELVSALQRWLCRKNRYNRFKLDQPGFEQLYWNGAFSSKQIELNGQILGLELTLFTDSPFAYHDEISVEYECLANCPFDLYDNSDETGSVSPSMQITLLSAGDFSLQNSMDKKIMKLSDCTAGEIIEIDGKNQIITSSDSSHNIPNSFNYFFPRIINTYHERRNRFTPSLDCNIKITYSPSRKVGL